MPIPPTSYAFASIFTVATRANRIAPSERVPSLVRGEDYSVFDGKHFIVRSAPRPAATLALRAAGVALPPTIRDAAVS